VYESEFQTFAGSKSVHSPAIVLACTSDEYSARTPAVWTVAAVCLVNGAGQAEIGPTHLAARNCGA